jgi:ComF family protein
MQNFLLPPTCILCGHAGWQGLDLCASCYKELPRSSQCCSRCAGALNSTTLLCVCGDCLAHPPAFDKTHAPLIYQAEIRYLILGLKSNAQYQNARLLGSLLAEQLTQTPLPDCIIPVPLHLRRYKERGFNQSIEIARAVGKVLQIPVDVNSCIRHRDTPHQTSLTAKQRRTNIKNAFTVLKPIQGLHIAIIDDVMTTGSTVRELASSLKNAGAKRVDVWVCARA